MKKPTFLSFASVIKIVIIATAFLSVAALGYATRADRIERVEAANLNDMTGLNTPDPEKARAAFSEAVKVFFSARCANCHPGGDSPTQGDAMLPHQQNVIRGKDGKGVYGMACTTCHQHENLAGEHLPPGTSKDWHMPPADRRMVFQNISAAELCRNFKDPAKNGGHKTLREAMDHIQKKDPLVMWGWNPGNGRTLPPMSFEEFSAKIEEWVKNGGDCPK